MTARIRHSAKALVLIAFLIGGLAVSAHPLHSQAAGEPGWIGIRLLVPLQGPEPPRPAEPTEGIEVLAVYEGSPADRAGIRPGNVILRVDDEPATPERLVERTRSLDVGESITFRVRTADGVRNVEIQADTQPDAALALQDRAVRARIDSAWEGMIRRMDSVRMIIRDRPGEPARAIPPLPGEGRPATQEVALRLRELQMELLEVQTDRARLRGRIESARRRGQVAAADGEDRIRALDRRARDLETALREVYRALEPGRREDASSQRAERPPSRPFLPDVLNRSGAPRAPYAAGRDFVAGARLSSLNPALSTYFDGREGVLVLEVLEDSPAQRAGLVPGDVITAAAGRDFDTVEEMRSILIERGDEVADLRVIRRGEEMRVLLPR